MNYDLTRRTRRDDGFIVPAAANKRVEPLYRSYVSGNGSEQDGGEAGKIAVYLRILWRKKWLIGFVTIAAALAGLALTRFVKPVYRAQGLLEVQSVNVDYLNRGAMDPTASKDGYVEDSFIQTQKRLLKSESLLMRTKDKLAAKGSSEAGLPWPSGAQLSEDEELEKLADAVDVQSTGFTKLVEVSFQSSKPQYAADFVNTLCDEFIQQTIRNQREAIERTGSELSSQLGSLRAKLQIAEQELSSYAKNQALFITEGKENVDEVRLKQLQSELSAAQAARAMKQSQFEQIASGSPESLPSVLDDLGMKDTRSKIADLKQREAELSVTLTPAHYKTQALQAQITELERAYSRQRENIVRRLQGEYQSAKRREDLIADTYKAQSGVVSAKAGKALRYATLKREVDVNQQLYEAMLLKAKEAQVVSAMQASNIRVIDPARVPSRRSKPIPVRDSALAGALGFGFTALFVLVHGTSKTHVREPGEAGALLDVPELGAIPTNQQSTGRLLSLPGRRSDEDPAGITNQGDSSLHAESFRSLVTSILMQQVDGRSFSIVVTSPSVGDGKTSIVANLGLTLAGTGRKTLLIDGDLRRPMLHSKFKVKNMPGLIQALDLQGEANAAEYVQPTEVPNLFVLPSGVTKESIGSRLLRPTAIQDLLQSLRHQYQVILIDTPPVLHIADARAFARYTDGVVMILRSSKTKREFALDARKLFDLDTTRLLGVILNDWKPQLSRKGEAYYEYHDSYFAGTSA